MGMADHIASPFQFQHLLVLLLTNSSTSSSIRLVSFDSTKSSFHIQPLSSYYQVQYYDDNEDLSLPLPYHDCNDGGWLSLPATNTTSANIPLMATMAMAGVSIIAIRPSTSMHTLFVCRNKLIEMVMADTAPTFSQQQYQRLVLVVVVLLGLVLV